MAASERRRWKWEGETCVCSATTRPAWPSVARTGMYRYGTALPTNWLLGLAPAARGAGL